MTESPQRWVDDVGPWMDLLGAVLGMVKDDAVALRRRGLIDDDGNITPAGQAMYPPTARYGIDQMELRHQALAVARAQLHEGAKQPEVRALAKRIYPVLMAAAKAEYMEQHPPAPNVPLKGRGLTRRQQVESVGRMIYQGGIDRILVALGLEPFGWQLQAKAEREVAHILGNGGTRPRIRNHALR